MNLGNVLILLSLLIWIANVAFLNSLVFVNQRIRSEILNRQILIVFKPGYDEIDKITDMIAYFPGRFDLQVIKPEENLERLVKRKPELSARVKLVGINIVPASLIIKPVEYWTGGLWATLMDYINDLPGVEKITVLNSNPALYDFLSLLKKGVWLCLLFFTSIAFASTVVGLSTFSRMTRFLIVIFLAIGLLVIDYLIWRQSGEYQRWGLVIPFIAFISGLLALLPSPQEGETPSKNPIQLE